MKQLSIFDLIPDEDNKAADICESCRYNENGCCSYDEPLGRYCVEGDAYELKVPDTAPQFPESDFAEITDIRAIPQPEKKKKRPLLYIDDYRYQIESKKIKVSKWVKKFYFEYYPKLFEDEVATFDETAARLAVSSIEKFCRHHEGEKGGQLIELESWQKAFIAVLFGTKDKKGFRLFREIPNPRTTTRRKLRRV